ncbi:hypothetical protein BOTBODRAFT_64563 [Botryobasidium botryosum FD-172 SS1]|uniref:Isochorismatase-like domain-containing protein n=1 Tax=Botryobasidium botryosum (strain FD-172 SS1) TaxID=930990 RepID=A0A067MNJ2_BOTB1|nr:hypothetical protein BOTBODRAFT_64563 [Botryobasidium botryosum FD-172 SS1]
MTYSKGHTALVLVDPYNDFLAEGGKLYPGLESSLKSTGVAPRLVSLVASARAAGVPIFYAPHRQFRPGDFDGFAFPAKVQVGIKAVEAFKFGSWGGEFYEGLEPDIEGGDVVATEHFTYSAFENTNLSFQLRKHGITHIALAGLTANTCIEATGRYAVELAYHVTMLKDATADFTAEALKTSVDINYPGFAHEVKTADEWLKEVQP